MLGKTATGLWFFGLLLGLVMARVNWHGLLITGIHGVHGLYIIPILCIGIFTGLYMDKRKKTPASAAYPCRCQSTCICHGAPAGSKRLAGLQCFCSWKLNGPAGQQWSVAQSIKDITAPGRHKDVRVTYNYLSTVVLFMLVAQKYSLLCSTVKLHQ